MSPLNQFLTGPNLHTDLPLPIRKFLGALTGGALAEVLSFQTISFLFGEFLLAEVKLCTWMLSN